MAKIVQLKDRDNLDICPVVAAAATYMENGVSVEEKLNQIDNKLVTVDDSFDSTSLNPVQNKVITKQFNALASFVNTSYGDVLAATEDAKNSAREAYELAQAARIPTLTIPDTTASQELAPNVLYIFSTRTSTLTLTLGTPIDGIANEYHFFIECGSTAPTINFPSGIIWNGENAPEIAANKTYEVSILNNIAAYFEI